MTDEYDDLGIRGDVEALFQEKDARGRPKFGEVDAKAVLAVVLLEFARRQELEALSPAGRVELARLLDVIGISDQTAPEQVKPLMQRFFKELGANAAIFVAIHRILARRKKVNDRIEAADASAAIYQKLAARDAPTAPGVEDQAPEGSKSAQSLAQSLGVKVRI